MSSPVVKPLVLRPPQSLDLFLLRYVDLPAVAFLQETFAKEIEASARHRAVMLLCEHPPCCSKGTERLDPLTFLQESESARTAEREAERWVRPGTLWEHGPGQLSIYLTMSLRKTEMAPESFHNFLRRLLVETCRKTGLKHFEEGTETEIHGRTGCLANFGAHVRETTAHSAAYLNVFTVHQGETETNPTSLTAEMMQPVEMQSVKSALIGVLSDLLPHTDIQTFTSHPLLKRFKAVELAQLKKDAGNGRKDH